MAIRRLAEEQRLSGAVVAGGMVWLAGQVADDSSLDAEGQTADILRQIDFELPVYEAVYQMNERLDGSGYPKGLQDGEISLQARVLSVANSFCAMIRPRSYRPAMSTDQTLEIMRASAGSYDSQVLDALQSALGTARGSRVLEKAMECAVVCS